MKSLILKLIFPVLFLSISLTACSGDDEVDSSNNSQLQIETNVIIDTWRITKFIDSGNDELNHFTNYNFTFLSNGIVTASNNINTYSGNWSVTKSNSSDNSLNDLDFNILFLSPPDFEELSDDWHFISQSNTKIELIDVSGGNGGTDYLTFEKN